MWHSQWIYFFLFFFGFGSYNLSNAKSNDLDSIKKKSTLCLPILVSLPYLEQVLEKEVPQNLHSEKNIDAGYGIKLDLNIIRSGKIQLKSRELTLEAKAPIKIAALLHWNAKEKLRINLQKSQNFEAELNVILRTNFQIGKNWQLLPKTSAEYTWIKEPSLSLLSFSINLGKIVDPTIKEQLREVSKMIDKEIQKNIVLQKELDSLLSKLATPIPILPKNNFMWLVVQPSDIGIRQVEDKTGLYLRFQASIQMDLLTAISHSPPPSININPRIIHNNTATTFCEYSSFRIPIIAEYATLAQVAKEILGSQKIPINKKYKAQVKDIQLDYKGERIFTTITFDLIKKNKKIYPSTLSLKFKPLFNENSQKFWVENLQYQLHSSMPLIKIGNKLFPQKIRQKMDTEIESTIEKAMQEFKSNLKKGLKFHEKDLHLAIDTQVLRSDILNFRPDESAISFVIDAQALIQLKVE